MNIHIASDHAGLDCKNKIKDFLQKEEKMNVIDHGAYIFDEMDDYPDFVIKAARNVASDCVSGQESCGIIFGGSGQGEAIVANRIKGVRCCVYYGYDMDIISLSREHNNANMLSIGARFVNEEDIVAIVKKWIETPFTHENRHERRIQKIDSYLV